MRTKNDPSRRSACPGNARLIEAFLQEGDATLAKRVADHLDGCPLCRHKFTILGEIARDVRVREADLPIELGPREEAALRKMARDEIRGLRKEKRSRFLPISLPLRATAAAVLVVAAAAGVLFLVRAGRQDVARGDQNRIELLEPSKTLDRAPSVFRWAAVAGAGGYDFEIFDDALRPVVFRSVKSTSTSLSPEEQAQILPGRTYFWGVEAFDDERRLLASRQRSFLFIPSDSASR